MVLAFRLRDYNIIKDTAEQENSSISTTIVNAVRLIGMDPNLYTNPDRMEDYSAVEIVEVDVTSEAFRLIVDKANFHNYSVEVFVCEAVKIYRTVNALSDICEDSAAVPSDDELISVQPNLDG